MRLVHYTNRPLPELELRTIADSADCFRKPRGLWVSDDDCEENWREWCLSERFGLERMTHVYDVEIADGADVVVLRSAWDIDGFTREWGDWYEREKIRWPDVQARYQGIIITPYIWERRLDRGANWYYGWDCASGCIWDPDALASVTLREIVPVSEPVI
jgi:hypothetical protein